MMIIVSSVCWPARDGWSEPRVLDGQAAERGAAASVGDEVRLWADGAV